MKQNEIADQVTTEAKRQDSLVARTLKFFLNLILWSSLIFIIIDLVLYSSSGQLITDRIFSARRKHPAGKTDEMYFGTYAVFFILGCLSFGILFIYNAYYLLKHRISLVEERTGSRLTFYNNPATWVDHKKN